MAHLTFLCKLFYLACRSPHLGRRGLVTFLAIYLWFNIFCFHVFLLWHLGDVFIFSCSTFSIRSQRYTRLHEPPHDKTNKMTCALSVDSDQPGLPPRLIRVFAVRMKNAWVLSYPLSAQQRLIKLGGCSGWSESSLGAHVILLVLSAQMNYYLHTFSTFATFITLDLSTKMCNILF